MYHRFLLSAPLPRVGYIDKHINKRMKHAYLTHILPTAVLTAAVLGACSGDDGVVPASAETLGVAVDITFRLDGSVQTRATRPLMSSDNWQRTTDVRIYIFRSDTEGGTYTCHKQQAMGKTFEYTYVPLFEKDTWGATDVWGDDEKGMEQHRCRLNANLKRGYYKLLAIGRDDISETDESGSMMALSTLDNGTTPLGDLTLTCTDAVKAAEVFTGTSDAFCVDFEGYETTTTIEMTRAVAGLLMYVENVPAAIGSVRVAAIGVEHVSATPGVTAYSKTACGAATTDVCLLKHTFDVSAPTSSGYYVNTTTNTTDIEAGHPNSVCLGTFLTPQSATTAGSSSLQLVYYDADGNKLKTMKVKLATELHDGEDNLHYSLRANHFYSLGQRNSDTNQPLDLGTKPDAIILVEGSWQEDVEIEL